MTLDYVNTVSTRTSPPLLPSCRQLRGDRWPRRLRRLPAGHNSTSFIVGKATPTVSVSDNGGTYNGSTAFPGHRQPPAGVALESVGLTDYVNTASNQDLGATAPVAAGIYQVTASFAGSADYLPASNSTTFTIGKATPAVGGSTGDGTTGVPVMVGSPSRRWPARQAEHHRARESA